MPKINIKKIKEFYNTVPNVWSGDIWHSYSRKMIFDYISAHSHLLHNTNILNVGSAGNSYNIKCKSMYHVDIANEKIKNVKNAFVANAEKLPFKNCIFDNILCVGSVLNYCDAMLAISEFSRVIKKHGNLILEFESSYGFEYINKEFYKKQACVITTEYIEKNHQQWLYSPNYIFKILREYGFKVIQVKHFHIIDGLLSKYINDKNAVTIAKTTDNIFNHIPYLKKHGNNIIVVCSKGS